MAGQETHIANDVKWFKEVTIWITRESRHPPTPEQVAEGRTIGDRFDLPPTMHKVRIEVDVSKIARVLGRKAIDNKTGVARDGFVTVKEVRME